MDLLRFREEVGKANPDLLQLLEFLRSIEPSQGTTVVRTALTCDTVSPWGNDNAQLERYSDGMHP